MLHTKITNNYNDPLKFVKYAALFFQTSCVYTELLR